VAVLTLTFYLCSKGQCMNYVVQSDGVCVYIRAWVERNRP